MSNCIQCSQTFTVTAAEQAFLQKVQLPEPRLCSQCRWQWRYSWRNERKLYHRTCSKTGKQIISVYHPNSPYPVYEKEEWLSDNWDALTYGRDIDWNRPFFEQWNDLMLKVPKIPIFASNNINTDYGNGIQQDKNCYMIFVSDHNEDCYYSYGIDSCRDCLECLNCFECEQCIECIDCSTSYNLRYCQQSHNCKDSYFLHDCKSCTECFGCWGLRNSSHCIFNQQHTEAEYCKKLEELNTGNRQTLQAAQNAFTNQASQQHIHLYYDGNNNDNVTGDHIVNCRNCIECYDSADLEDCGYLFSGFKSKDCFDGHVNVDNCQLCYGAIAAINQYNTQFTFVSFYSKNSMYLDECHYCNFCFGCAGLKKKEYCILNKQYSEQEYNTLKQRLIQHMQQTGEWGMPLPPHLSHFGYNETVAQEYFPLSKEEATKKRFRWFEDVDVHTSAYQGPKTTVPHTINEVSDDFSQNILECSTSGKPFKFIPQEIALYKQHNLPLPLQCFDERHQARLGRRNPRQLWQRECNKCKKQLMSSFNPSRPDTIYCKECYLAAVY